MATNPYITFTTSNSSLSKRFRVIQSGFNPTLEKGSDVRRTIGGSIDISMGSVYETHEYIIKVREEEVDSNYGTKDELRTFFELNNPNGAPSNKIKLTDHFGIEHQIYMVGNLGESLLTAAIEGTEAWYTVKCTVLFIP